VNFQTTDNEVARLRELLNRAIDNCECDGMCDSYVGNYCNCGRLDRNDKIRDELARLAPAPEEPVFISAKLFAQNKINTPRVDALYFSFHTHAEIVDLARSLERENAELVQALKSLQARLG
jgi:hypothetical protein